MHRNTDETRATESDECTHAMSDRVTRKRNFGIAIALEQTPATFADAVE